MRRRRFECVPERVKFEVTHVPFWDITSGLRDIDGNLYTSVIIGSQEWLVGNYRTKHYADGTAIPNITDGALWAAALAGAYCYYNNDVANSLIYGALYNGFVIDNAHGFVYLRRDGVEELGWRVPINDDWVALRAEVGGVNTAGGILKDTLYWSAPNTGAVNSVGWTGRGGGVRDNTTGAFSALNEYGLFLSDPEEIFPIPVDWTMQYDAAAFEGGANPYELGRSVRLVRDVVVP